MTRLEVKNYLHVDISEDDAMIDTMMLAAEEFIIEAVGEYNEEKARAKMLFLAVVQDMYDNRTFVASSTQGYSVSEAKRHMIDSMITQLQLEYDMEQPEG